SRPMPWCGPGTSATRRSCMAGVVMPGKVGRGPGRVLGVLGGAAAAKNAQDPPRSLGYPGGAMLPLPAPDEPLRIEIARPAALPGVTVGRFVSDGRLHCGVKDRVGTVQNYAGHCEWWARRRVWQSRPGTLQLKLPGEVHRELRRDGPARFQVVLFEDELLVEASEALGLRFTAPASLAIAGDSPVGAPLARLHALLL